MTDEQHLKVQGIRWLPTIAFGTQGYPEKVARRLRAMNIAAWIGAAVTASFAVRRLLDPAPDKWIPGVVNAIAALCLASTPFLHRFSPLAAPLVLIAFAYAYTSWVVHRGGTNGGAWLYYISATVLLVLLLGTERFVLSAVLCAVAAGLIIAVHIIEPPNTGYLSPESLFYGNFITNVLVNAALLFSVVQYAMRQLARAEATAEREFERSESLLLNILPATIAERLKTSAQPLIADKYEEASILFADMAGFTARAGDTTPEGLVQFLNHVFTGFDRLVERHGLEKIKTTGDAYMVVSGVPTARPDHVQALADFALAMRDAAADLGDPHQRAVPIRIGIACGPVVAGVVGTRKIFYDVWGDTVNVASRMESTGEAGQIQVSPGAYERLRDEFVLERRGLIDVKGKGSMVTWFLVGRNQAKHRVGVP